jgi:hypothetical protein
MNKGWEKMLNMAINARDNCTEEKK